MSGWFWFLTVILTLTGGPRIYYFFAQKRLKVFLWKFCQDPASEALVAMAKKRGIRIAPFDFFLKLTSGGKIAMLANANYGSKSIAISENVVEEFLKGKGDLKILRLSFAHELGHLRETYQIALEFQKEREQSCNIEMNCLYEEVMATKTGIGFVEEISGRPIEKETLSSFHQTLLKQCQDCISFLLKDSSKCPRLKEPKGVAEVNNQERIITLLPLCSEPVN